MTLKQLLIPIVIEFRNRYGMFPTKTKLLKLAYLVDLFHARKFATPLTEGTWIYYLYGPYRHDYGSAISEAPFETEDVDLADEKTATVISVAPGTSSPVLPLDAKNMVVRAVFDYGGLPLRELLDFVYFETEPMINAQERMEQLDFSTVKPDSYYKVHKLYIDPKEEERLRKKFRESRGKMAQQ
jgi:hypothetical protein